MRARAGMVERASANDLMELASDVGPVPLQIAGVLLLEPGAAWDVAAARDEVARRLAGVPRLRQVLVRAPLGCGRPYWVDDAGFDARRHVDVVRCPAPGDERALLGAALTLTGRRLPRSRPLWSATLVTDLEHGRVGLVLVLHHVVADGIGGLAVLGALVGGGPTGSGAGASIGSAPAPSRRALAADAWSGRLQTLRGAPTGLRRLRAAVAELGTGRPRAAPRTSLNLPTGPRRAAGVARVALADVLAAAHAHGGTVNDVVLTAATGALGTVLAGRGETVTDVVVSVPVSARAADDAEHLGNRVGVIPLRLPTTGTPAARLEAVAAITRARRTATPGASAALLQPVFRGLAGLGVLRWFVDHQRLVTSFVTNVRGPATPMTVLGAPVHDIIPISGIQGNVTVAFAALSYAGTLTVTVLADPDAVPEHAALTAALQADLTVWDRRYPAGPARRG